MALVELIKKKVPVQIVVEKEQLDKVKLELTIEQVLTIYSLVGKVTGNEEYSPRKYSSEIFLMLDPVVEGISIRNYFERRPDIEFASNSLHNFRQDVQKIKEIK